MMTFPEWENHPVMFQSTDWISVNLPGLPTGQAQFSTDHGGFDVAEVVFADLGRGVAMDGLSI